ncbi:MAG: Cna protein B-type domain containing protein [Gammaproteobacteria bacterium]|nr:Cna protein B-type domain containing protein [Gammaproteobacteria bacterium]
MQRTILFLILLIVTPLSQAQTATGRVFIDENRNGLLDEGEVGLANVRVSNGASVVRTDATGRYRLAADEQTIIFITKPSNYAIPVNQHMLPQFYYIHQPNGSPARLRYKGIEPTGPLPAEINFPLIERPEKKKFEALLFADTQPQTTRELDYIRDDVVAELVGADAAFGMTMGDIMFDDLSMLPRYNAIISKIGIPWYNVPGNHEINFESTNDRYSLETFKKFYGPPYFAFEYADALFVVLDNIDYKGGGEADPADVRGNGGYEARISRSQLQWLAEELKHVEQERLVFIATHAPLGSENGSYATDNREKLFRLLAGRPNLYSVAGHTHTTDHVYFDKDDGFAGPGKFHHHVLATVSGAWWSGPFDERGIAVSDQRDGTPNGYHILEVDSTDVAVRFKGAGKPADYQMRIVFDVAHHQLNVNGIRDFKAGELLDGRISQDHLNAAAIIVNLFDGGPNSKVRYRVEDGEYRPLKRVLRKDPYMLEQYARHRSSKKNLGGSHTVDPPI